MLQSHWEMSSALSSPDVDPVAVPSASHQAPKLRDNMIKILFSAKLQIRSLAQMLLHANLANKTQRFRVWG